MSKMRESEFGKTIIKSLTPYLMVDLNEEIEKIAELSLRVIFQGSIIDLSIVAYMGSAAIYRKEYKKEWIPHWKRASNETNSPCPWELVEIEKGITTASQIKEIETVWSIQEAWTSADAYFKFLGETNFNNDETEGFQEYVSKRVTQRIIINLSEKHRDWVKNDDNTSHFCSNRICFFLKPEHTQNEGLNFRPSSSHSS